MGHIVTWPCAMTSSVGGRWLCLAGLCPAALRPGPSSPPSLPWLGSPLQGNLSCHKEGSQTLYVRRSPPKPAVLPWGGFLPASSPCPTSDRGHDKACSLLTSVPAAICSVCSPRTSPPLGLSLLLQGSRLRARLSLPSCSPVSRAFFRVLLLASLLFSLSSFCLLCPLGTAMHLWVMASAVGTQMQSWVVSLGQGAGGCHRVRKGRVPAAPPSTLPWCASLCPRGEQRWLKLWGCLGAWGCRWSPLHPRDGCQDPHHPSPSPPRALLRPSQ